MVQITVPLVVVQYLTLGREWIASLKACRNVVEPGRYRPDAVPEPGWYRGNASRMDPIRCRTFRELLCD